MQIPRGEAQEFAFSQVPWRFRCKGITDPLLHETLPCGTGNAEEMGKRDSPQSEDLPLVRALTQRGTCSLGESAQGASLGGRDPLH